MCKARNKNIRVRGVPLYFVQKCILSNLECHVIDASTAIGLLMNPTHLSTIQSNDENNTRAVTKLMRY